jgi:hypothetical protein
VSLLVAGSLALTLLTATPDTYTERSLCDLVAGAQCHATSCLKDSKERCAVASRKCRDASRATVPKERADKSAACAKATLDVPCGAAAPAECQAANNP